MRSAPGCGPRIRASHGDRVATGPHAQDRTRGGAAAEVGAGHRAVPAVGRRGLAGVADPLGEGLAQGGAARRPRLGGRWRSCRAPRDRAGSRQRCSPRSGHRRCCPASPRSGGAVHRSAPPVSHKLRLSKLPCQRQDRALVAGRGRQDALSPAAPAPITAALTRGMFPRALRTRRSCSRQVVHRKMSGAMRKSACLPSRPGLEIRLRRASGGDTDDGWSWCAQPQGSRGSALRRSVCSFSSLVVVRGCAGGGGCCRLWHRMVGLWGPAGFGCGRVWWVLVVTFCASWCRDEAESLILAQNERWRRA